VKLGVIVGGTEVAGSGDARSPNGDVD